MKNRTVASVLAIAAMSFAATAFAQECKNRGDLDPMYCDDNGDMVADVPKDPKKLKNPNTIVFTYTPVEDPAVYEKIFKPFTDHLAQCTAKKRWPRSNASNRASCCSTSLRRRRAAGLASSVGSRTRRLSWHRRSTKPANPFSAGSKPASRATRPRTPHPPS